MLRVFIGNMSKTLRIFAIFLIFLLILTQISFSLRNPAAVYCEALGYKYELGGICILPNGQKVNAWDFLLGKVAQEYSYCKKMGYEIKTVKNFDLCFPKYLIDECAFCILPNGSEIEVSILMNLDFRETYCGDKICGFGENFENCPMDCPSGSMDAYCDGEKDGICDPDCVFLNITYSDPDCAEQLEKYSKVCLNIRDGVCDKVCPNDPDCKSYQPYTPTILLTILLALIITILFIRKKLKENEFRKREFPLLYKKH